MTRDPSHARRAALEKLTLKPASVRRLSSPSAERPDSPALAVLDRIRAEFAEMPGLSLTVAQASRLLDIQEDICARLLHHLVESGVLRRRGDGRYVLKAAAA